jgi:hypothetical protein
MAAETNANPLATFDPTRVSKAEDERPPVGAAPRPKMQARLRPLADLDPRTENAQLPWQANEQSQPDPR